MPIAFDTSRSKKLAESCVRFEPCAFFGPPPHPQKRVVWLQLLSTGSTGSVPQQGASLCALRLVRGSSFCVRVSTLPGTPFTTTHDMASRDDSHGARTCSLGCTRSPGLNARIWQMMPLRPDVIRLFRDA